jgi:AbiU2
MTPEEAAEKLNNYLLKGVQSEITWAEEARALSFTIGRNALVINNNNFGLVLGRLQEICAERETLCVAKIFDKPHSRHPLRSIPAILDLIEENADLWNLPGRELLEPILFENGYGSFEEKSNKDVVYAIVRFYRDSLPSVRKRDECELSASLNAVLQSRNKVHAHNEAIAREERNLPSWSDTEKLTEFARDFVNTIIYGFLEISAIIYEADRPARQMETLLGVCGLATEEFYSNDANYFLVERLRKKLIKELR